MRKAILSLMFVIGILPLQADEYDYLWLHSSVASATCSYSIDDLRKITFDDDSLQVYLKSQSSSIAWAYADLCKMTFEAEPAATTVKSIPRASDLVITRSLSEIRVESPSPLKFVVIYDLQGSRLAIFGKGETAVSFSLNTLPAGVYVVRAESAAQAQSLKLVKH